MKKLFFFLFAILFAASCEMFEDNNNGNDSSTLNGDTDIELNKVGNLFTGAVYLGGELIETNESVTITNNDDGLITVRIKCDLPVSSPLFDLIPEYLKNGKGNLDFEAKYKCTSEGILDYTNADLKPFILVRYDAKVGDTYLLEKDNGMKITRTVTARSTTDDYPFGFFKIKTVTVEQDSRIPGVEKIVYNANHKFGLVGVDVYLEDRSMLKMTLDPPVE